MGAGCTDARLSSCLFVSLAMVADMTINLSVHMQLSAL